MPAAPILIVLGFLLFTGASFFFALAETALFTLGQWQARALVERPSASGGRLARLLAAPQELLATIVLGNTLANAGLVFLGMWLVLDGRHSPALILPVVLLLILFVGEVIPKALAVRAPDYWAVRLARPLEVLKALSRPLRELTMRLDSSLLRWAVPRSVPPTTATTTEDYTELLELAFQQGALEATEKEILLQIISLDRRTAKDVMKPRSQMVGLPDNLPVEEMVAAARRHKHRRLPLYDESLDTIVGVLNTGRLLLDPDGDLSEAIEFPSFVPETMNLLQLLKSLQVQRRGLAIVLDEYGSTAGLVTTEDILTSVIGGLRREGGAEGFVMERVAQGRWRVNGTMRLDDFRREYPALGTMPDVDTMGGLLVALLGVVPAKGQSVRFGGVRLTTADADERRVREVFVELVR